MREGFKTSSTHKLGSVLGGGFDDAVSFTDNLSWACCYQLALQKTRQMLDDPDWMYSDEMWDNLIYHFGKGSWHKSQLHIAQDLISRTKDPIEKERILFHMLPIIFNGRFPLMFGTGLRKRLSDADICILKIDPTDGPERWTVNPTEKEYRIYDPEKFNLKNISEVPVGHCDNNCL